MRRRLTTTVGPRFVLATSFHAIDAFLGSHVSDRSKQAVLTDLTTHKIVDTILEVVYLRNAGDLRLVECV